MLRSYKFVETAHSQLHNNIIAFFNRIEFETADYSTTFFENNFYDQIVSHHKIILETPLKQIFEIVKKWDQDKRTQLCKRIRESNDIKKICNRELTPLKLTDIDAEITNVVDIKKLFSDLYNQVLYGNNCKAVYGDMQEHFRLFKNLKNNIFKCPICGLLPQNSNEEKKEDYDHLLPYTIYPFSSVNFENLAPICFDCNSDYKGYKDVLENDGKKIFFYYDDSHKGIKISAKLVDENKLTFSFSYTTSDNREEEIASWDEIFKINTRYEKRAKGKAEDWYRRYWEFLEKPKFKTFNLDIKKEIYMDCIDDSDIEAIKIPIIMAMENSAIMSRAYQEAAQRKMAF